MISIKFRYKNNQIKTNKSYVRTKILINKQVFPLKIKSNFSQITLNKRYRKFKAYRMNKIKCK